MRLGAASAGQLFDSYPVGDNETSAPVVDQLPFSKTLGNAGDARPMNTQHTRDMLVRDPEAVTTAAPLKRQQPAAKSLLDRVERITNNPLRQLLDLPVYVVVQQKLELGIGNNLAFEKITADRQCGSRHTNLHAVGCPTRVESRRDTDRAFAADNSHFDRSAILKDLEFGHDRSFRKVYIVDFVVLLVEILVLRKSHALKKLTKPDQVLRPEVLEQSVARGPRCSVIDKHLVSE
jgi:hypothetical protein